MANKSKRTKRQPTRRNKPTAPRRVGGTGGKRPVLDKDAASYAALLADPINAPLVHPIYTGGDGGYLLRADSTFNVGAGVTDNSGYLHWTPGAIGPSGSDLVFAATASSGTAQAGIGIGASANTPGYTFLTSNAAGARVVAASLQLAYIGSEQSRAGRIHYGQTTGGLIDIADSTSPDSVGGSLPNWERTPQDTIQINLRPGVSETIFQDPQTATAAQTKDRCQSLTVAWAGLPGSTGMYVHLTVVYEWKPSVAKGLTTSSGSQASSSNSLDDVLNYLHALGYEFVGRAGQVTGSVIGAGVMSMLSNRMANARIASNRRQIA